MLNNFRFSYQDILIDIPFFSPVTAICGVSGCGKSFLWNALADQVAQETSIGSSIRLIGARNYGQWVDILPDEKVYVIDNIDTLCLLHPEVVDYVNCGSYNLLVFGREFSRLQIDYSHIGTVQLDKSSGSLLFIPQHNGYEEESPIRYTSFFD